jgi:hypothetical protein
MSPRTSLPLITRETGATLTPATRATSRIVGRLEVRDMAWKYARFVHGTFSD